MLLKVKITYYIVQKSGFLKCRQNENSKTEDRKFFYSNYSSLHPIIPQ